MTRHPATAALTAATGFVLTALAIFWPLAWWAIPAHIVGIVALAVGAHGLVAAEDPPRHQQGRRTADGDGRLVVPSVQGNQEGAA